MSARRPLLIRNIGELLTLAEGAVPRRGAALRELGIVKAAALLAQGGTIVAAGPRDAVERRALTLDGIRDAIEYDAAGRVVLPGFVDSHTHLVFGAPRLRDFEMRLAGADYAAIAAAGGGIRASMRAVREADAETLERGARAHVDGFARHGTTTLEAKTGYALDRDNELKTLVVLRRLDARPLDIVPTYLGAHIVPPEFDTRADEYITWIARHFLPELAATHLARFADVYCDRGAYTLAQSRRYLEAARALGFALKIHAEQFEATGAARLAVELGATSADHLEHATAADAAALAASETVATLLPGSVFHLALERYAPARMLIDAGAAVALATDFNPGTSPTLSMPMVIALACRMMKMTPAEAIAAATINGACALGRAAQCGSLEAGKDADAIVVNATDHRELAYYFGANPVEATFKRGRLIYSESEVPHT
jgi:imidazolonepropionase